MPVRSIFAGVVFTQHYDICQPACSFYRCYYVLLGCNEELLTSPRPVHCCTCGLTHYLYSVAGLVGDNWYVAVLFNI